jgi:hypothetical protein
MQTMSRSKGQVPAPAVVHPVTRITVRLQPRAASNEIAGFDAEGVLRARVTAAPVEGAANSALIELLATALDVPKSSISIVRGLTGRTKVIEFRRLDAARIRSLALQARKRERIG